MFIFINSFKRVLFKSIWVLVLTEGTGDKNFVYMTLNGNENIDRNIFFSFKKDRTRGYQVTLVRDQCRLDIRMYSFSQRTINEWNKLA